MKRINYLLITLVLLPIFLLAQNKPGGATKTSATPVAVPAAYTNSIITYIRTWEPDMPLVDTTAISTRKVREVKQSTQYFDGLGFPLQTVGKAISPEGRDVVVPLIYDAYGREAYKYLPYTQLTGNTSDGKFKTDPFNSQKVFYQSAVSNSGSEDHIFYTKTEFEQSPLSRETKTYASGDSWAGKPVEKQFLTNLAADSVRIWTVSSGTITNAGIYTAGTLYKNTVIDERGALTVEYKDKENRVILKKSQKSPTSAAHVGWICTYYIYDEVGNLQFVIPPLATELAMLNNWSLTNVLDELCFQYTFDSQHRIITRKMPGTGLVAIVYDSKGRVAFTQDAVQAAKSTKEWLAYFYDGLDREVMTAIYVSNSTRQSLQDMLNTAATNQNIATTIPVKADLSLYEYDNATSYIATNSIAFLVGFDSGSNGEFTAEISSGATESITASADNSLANIMASSLTPLTYTFYDNYDYSGRHNFIASDLQKVAAADTLYPDVTPDSYSKMTQGRITGTKTRILGTSQFLTKTLYYNDNGREIQAIWDNGLGGRTISTSLSSFKGKLLSNYTRTQNPASPTPQTGLVTSNIYDNGGRLIAIKENVDGDASGEKIITTMSYDELGRIKQKQLGVDAGGRPLDSLNYRYHVRGWLNGINSNYVNTTSATSNFFGEDLSYDYGFVTNQYNGNISGVKWKSKSDGIARAYGYSYDTLNRITAADFTQSDNSGTNWNRDVIDFTVSNVSYDKNGNLLSMNQKGMVGTASRVIDDLKYTYQTNGSNKLVAVSDTSNTTTAKLGDFINGNTSVDDYSYDANGNLKVDKNKGITKIVYNHLNLPDSVYVKSKGTIAFTYDALGKKIGKIVVDSTVIPVKTIKTFYAGNLIYKRDTLELIAHNDGRIRPVYQTNNTLSYVYEYFEKDHLGNVRVILGDKSDSSLYVASMETAALATETALFSNIEETRVEKPVGYPDESEATQNTFVARLNGKSGGNKIGPSLVLRVMAGDTISIKVKAFYKSNAPANKKAASIINEIGAAVVNVMSNGQSVSDNHEALANASTLTPDLNKTDFENLNENGPSTCQPDRLKSYLNFSVFDDQFKLVDRNSGVKSVKNTPDELQELDVQKMVVETTGFLYVYTSNETTQDIYFDNLTVAVHSGRLIEDNHYYPFGLTMAGISNNALKGTNYPNNRFKFNNKELQSEEFNDGAGLNWYDYGARNYDPQVGRWHTIDPLSSKYEDVSPYTYAMNTPVNAIDPDGRLVIFVNGHWLPGGGMFGPSAPKEPYWMYFGSNVIKDIKNVFNDDNPDFVDGSTIIGFDESGSERFARGRKYAEEHYLEWIGMMANDDEEFNLVSHSEGSAFAAGIASYLNSRAWGPNKGHSVRNIVYLSADEADEFKQDNTNFPGNSVQVHNEKDWVSPYYPIQGVDRIFLIKDPRANWRNYHGTTMNHSVLMQLKDLVRQTINLDEFDVTVKGDKIIYHRK